MWLPTHRIRTDDRLQGTIPEWVEIHALAAARDGMFHRKLMRVNCGNPGDQAFCKCQNLIRRRTEAEGYFTVVDTPEAAHFVEEPGVNLFQCPRHGTWMYRRKMEDGNKFEWRCGIDGCEYSTLRPSPMAATG